MNKQTIFMTLKVVLMMTITAYLSGFVKEASDYVFVTIAIMAVGVFIFFIDKKKILRLLDKDADGDSAQQNEH